MGVRPAGAHPGARSVGRKAHGIGNPLPCQDSETDGFVCSTGLRNVSSVCNLRLDKLRQQGERFLPAEITRLGRNDAGTPSCTTFNSVAHETLFSVIVVIGF